MAISFNSFHRKGTTIPIVDGGTGGSTDSAARTNLGIDIYDLISHDALVTHAIEAADEGGGSLGAFSLLRFLGAGVTAANGGGGELDITIPGSTSLKVASVFYNTTNNISLNPSFTNYPIMAIAIGTEVSPDTQGIHVGVCVGENGSVIGQGNVQVDGIGGTELDTYTDGYIINATNPVTKAEYQVTTFTNSSVFLTRSGSDPTQVMQGRLFVIGS